MADDGISFLLQLVADVEGAVKFNAALVDVERQLKHVTAATKHVETATKGVTKMAAVAKPAIAQLREPMEGFAGAVGGATKMLGAFGQFASTALGSAVGGAIGGMVSNAVSSVGGGILSIGKMALGAAADAQRTEAAFRNMLGVQAGDEMLDWIDQVSKKTEFTGDVLKGFSMEFMRVGLRGEDVRRSLAASLDIASTFADPMAGMQAATSALANLQLTGNVNKGTLKAFGLNDDQFFGDLAAQMGVGVKTVKEQMSAGKIEVDRLREALFSAIAKKSGKPLGALGIDLAPGMKSQLEKLMAMPEDILQSLSKTQGFAQITKMVERLQTALSGDFGSRLTANLAKMADRFGSWLSTIDVEATMGKIIRAFELLAGVAGKVASAIGFVADNWKHVQQVKLGLDLITNPASTLGKTFGTAMVAGANQGADGAKDGLWSTIKGIAKGASGSFADTLKIHSPSRVFMGYGAMTVAGFNAGLLGAAPTVDSAVDRTFAVAPPIGSVNASGIGSRSVTVNLGGMTFPVNVPGAAPSPVQIAEALAAELPSAVQAVFEKMALELAVA